MNTDSSLKDYIETIPILPTSLIKVLEICDNPQTGSADLNHVISLDPVLVGRVFKLINSAYNSLEQPVRSITRAIIMLGMNTVKNLALSTTAVDHLWGNSSSGLDMLRFWMHSLCVGISAKLLAKKRGISPQLAEEYFIAGFLHDIGKIPINAILSREYLMTVSIADREHKPLIETETKTLGLNHCEIGAMIAVSWKLQGAVGDAIMHHHIYDEYKGDYKDILYCVIAANHFASSSGTGFSGNSHPGPIPAHIWETLKVSSDIWGEIEKDVNLEIEKAAAFLKISLV